jgi:peptidoglycan/LPS O-acetylase OafA/YrhL
LGIEQAVPLLIWSAVLWSSVQPVHSLGHRLARLLGSRPAFHMGEISYSIYLLHMIPLYGSIFLLDRAGIGGTALQAIATFATILVTYALANLAYRWIEKPGIELGGKLTGPKLAPAPQLAS